MTRTYANLPFTSPPDDGSFGYRVAKFKAPKTACRGCHLREQCLRHPDRTPQCQLTIIKRPEGPPPRKRENRDAPTRRMRRKFDTPLGREIYSRRMGTIEPVFANIQNKGMRRFTLRGQSSHEPGDNAQSSALTRSSGERADAEEL